MVTFPFNERIRTGPNQITYFYRGYHRNEYGVVTHFMATSATSLKLKKVSQRNITKYHRNWRLAE